MKIRLTYCTTLITLLASLLSFSSAAWSEKVLVLGDSLSAAYNIPWDSGWVQLLSNEVNEKYKNQHQIINASVSGETTGGGLARLPKLLVEHEPDWVIIELGGNDGLRGYPVQVITKNMQRMIDLIKSQGAKATVFGVRIPPNYGERYNQAFQSSLKRAAKDNALPFYELYQKEIAINELYIQEDGIHPTKAAQPLIKDAVAAFLIPVLGW